MYKKESMGRGRRLLGIFAAAMLGITGCGQMESEDVSQQTQAVSQAKYEEPKEIQTAEEGLKVHFLDVGQADSILIQTADAAMLVDAGTNEKGQAVVSYIREQGIETLDYVIGTHPHEDHIGGLDDVIRELDVREVILPDKIHTTKTFEDVLDAVEEKQLSVTVAHQGDAYTLGDASFTIVAPCEGKDYGDELNNWSVGIRLVYGNTSFLMTGDAEKQAEEDMLATGENLQADVWKAAHHGSSTSNTAAMLDAVQPTYAVISCGKDNSYGHPHRETLEAFAERGIQVFRTDEQGTVVVTSDGQNLSFAAGDTAGEQETVVHITKSGKKYHREGCDGLSRSDIEITLKEAKERGYEPCKSCNPPV